MKQYLAIDNGGTFIKYGLFDRSGEIVSQGKSATPKRDASEEVYFTVLDEIVARFQGDICGICFSTPGRVEENGILQTAGALPYLAGRNLKELASARYGLPVSVENDGKCAALAEYWKGSLRGVKNGAVLVIGTGIGGGLILNGKLFRGSHGSAGEVNDMILSAGDAFSLYSLATASVSTLSLCYGVAKIKGEDVRTMTGERVMALVQAGDAAAEAAFAAFCRKAAYLIFSIQALADLDAVAIGGGISRDPIVVDNIRREYLALYREPAFASIGGCPCIPADIFPCLFENDANLIGALAHHLDETGEAAI